MKRLSIVPLLLTVLAISPRSAPAASENPFLVKPYLQLASSEDPASLAVLWQTESNTGEWQIEWKAADDTVQTALPVVRTIALGSRRHYLYLATALRLKPGATFEYRVLLDGKKVFQADARAIPVDSNARYKFAINGDCGADTAGEKEIAFEIHKFKPDFVFIPGDIVYLHGLASEYQSKFFPVYNADHADRKSGGPLMRSTIFMAALGNHDIAGRDLGSYSDGLAYFYYWNFPLNGLKTFALPGFKAAPDKRAALAEASGGAFPKMSNYSFDYGNSHWLVLDSNPDVDWSRPELTGWVAQELASPAARKATWRFVGFHHPGFSSSHMHAGDQQMRVLSKVFEDANVDVVFSGHVHNYQRTAPLKFKLTSFNASKSHQAPGQWTIDPEYDGKSHTKPSGIIYLVSGAGGAFLYDKGQGGDRRSWHDFTVQFVSDVHSFTAVEINGGKATFRQVDSQGKAVDSFEVTK
jgi:hypothetical protein